jgi:hypothetical protein
VIALPPVEVGADHARTTCPLPAEPAIPVGEPGADLGIAADDAVENELVPARFVAATLNMYDTPFVNPVTVDEVLVDTPSANVDHETPLLDDH